MSKYVYIRLTERQANRVMLEAETGGASCCTAADQREYQQIEDAATKAINGEGPKVEEMKKAMRWAIEAFKTLMVRGDIDDEDKPRTESIIKRMKESMR